MGSPSILYFRKHHFYVKSDAEAGHQIRLTKICNYLCYFTQNGLLLPTFILVTLF